MLECLTKLQVRFEISHVAFSFLIKFMALFKFRFQHLKENVCTDFIHIKQKNILLRLEMTPSILSELLAFFSTPQFVA